MLANMEQAAIRTKVDDAKKELKHIHEELEKLDPALKKVCFTRIPQVCSSNWPPTRPKELKRNWKTRQSSFEMS